MKTAYVYVSNEDEFVALLKQVNIDSSEMEEVIGVSDTQFGFVIKSQSGMGLLKCGNLHEIAEQKKKEKLKKS